MKTGVNIFIHTTTNKDLFIKRVICFYQKGPCVFAMHFFVYSAYLTHVLKLTEQIKMNPKCFYGFPKEF